MMSKSTDETELIRALRKGSVKAFDALYDLYFHRIYGFCYQFTKSHKDTEDIVQEVFIKLWLSRSEIKNEESLGGLIFRIAKNHIISAHHSILRQPQYEDYLLYRESLGKEDTEWLEYHEFATIVNQAIESLPNAQQRIFKLSRIAGMSNREIAGLLAISEQTVKNQLVSSLKSIRKFLNNSAEFMTLVINITGVIVLFS